jgi:hypothetical protein
VAVTTIKPATLDDVVGELRRIATALGAAPRCGERRGGAVCVLGNHVGDHVSEDGRTRWLDEE